MNILIISLPRYLFCLCYSARQWMEYDERLILTKHTTNYFRCKIITVMSLWARWRLISPDVWPTVYSGTDQRKHQSSASLAFVQGIHRWPVNPEENVSIWWRHHDTHFYFYGYFDICLGCTKYIIHCRIQWRESSHSTNWLSVPVK